MREITMREVNKAIEAGKECWLWSDCGEGQLEKIKYVDANWWAHVQYMSYCICPNTEAYIFDSDAERAEYNQARREQLAKNRELWKQPNWWKKNREEVATM